MTMTEDVVQQVPACPICNTSNNLEVTPYIDAHHPPSRIFDGLSIVFCTVCGFGCSSPEIEEKAVNEFYEHTYRGIDSPHAIAFSELSKPVSYDCRSLAQLLLARHFVEVESGDSFADIGPGGGRSFASASTVLKTPKMYAVELSDGAAAAYKRIYGVDTFKSVKSLNEHIGRLKIILSSHSLEHFKFGQLESLFADVKNALSSDGVLVVEVPHNDMRIHLKTRNSDSPHFLFFSKESLRWGLESFGFDVLFLESCGASYEDWRHHETTKTARQDSSLKGKGRTAYEKMPMSVKGVIRRAYMHFRRESLNFGDANFSYGGNRACLRAVVRPGK